MEPNSDNAQQPQTPTQSTPPEATPAPAWPTPTSRSRKLKIWGIALVVGPTVLLIVTILLYPLVSLLSPSPALTSDSGALSAEQPLGKSLANIILFLAGGVSILTWLPSLIVGVILLGKSKRM